MAFDNLRFERTFMKPFLAFFLFHIGYPVASIQAQETWVDRFSFAKDPKQKVFSREGTGIRIKAPGGGLGSLFVGNNKLWTTNSDFALNGDFEIEVDFEVFQLGTPDGKAAHESNAEITVQGASPFSVYGINLNNDPGGPSFKVARIEPGERGTHYNLMTFPRKSNKGKLGIRRQGSVLFLLATDVPGEAPKELVRLPYDSRIDPRIRISAYQGSGVVPMPVDVLFHHFSIKAGQILQGKDADRPGPGDTLPQSYPIQLDYSKNPGRILADLKQTNDNRQTFQLDGNGIRVKPPVIPNAKNGEVSAYWYHDSAYTLRGNFEISLAFDVKEMAPAVSGGYGSVSLSIGLETNGPLGSISFGRGASRTDGQRFTITRYAPTSAGRHWDTQAFRTNAMKGRLHLRKTGEQLHFLVQDGDSPLRELFQCPGISSEPVRLRLHTDQGGTNAGVVDALITEFFVSGDDITENGRTVKSIRATSVIPGPGDLSDSEEPPSPRKWLPYLLGGGILAAVGLALFLLLRTKGSSAQEAPVPPQGQSPQVDPLTPKQAAPRVPPPAGGPQRPHSPKPAVDPPATSTRPRTVPQAPSQEKGKKE